MYEKQNKNKNKHKTKAKAKLLFSLVMEGLETVCAYHMNERQMDRWMPLQDSRKQHDQGQQRTEKSGGPLQRTISPSGKTRYI